MEEKVTIPTMRKDTDMTDPTKPKNAKFVSMPLKTSDLAEAVAKGACNRIAIP